MSGRMASSNQVAVVGYAQSQVERHADSPLGALTVDTARRAIADAGLTVGQLDGFVTASLFPSAGAHAVVDGVSLVSANWLAEHLGANPRYAAGFQGFGQLPGAVALAVNALASGAADYVLVHRALHNPRGKYHANPMTEVRGDQQWTVPQGYFGPLAMIALPYTEYVQRYGVTRDAMAAVVVEARKNGARIPWSYWHDRPLSAEEYLSEPMVNDPICRLDCDIPVDGVACFVFTSARQGGTCPTDRSMWPGTRRARQCATASRCTGPWTTSWRSALKRLGGCGSGPGSGRRRSTSRRSTTGSPRSCICGWRRFPCAQWERRTGWCSMAASTATGRRR